MSPGGATEHGGRRPGQEPGAISCLLVGDGASSPAGLEPLLLGRGYLVQRRQTLEEAVEHLRQRAADLLVVSQVGDAGLACLRQLRSYPRGQAAVALVMLRPGEPALLRQALDAGAFGALILPILEPQAELQLALAERELERLRTRAIPIDPSERFELLFEKNPQALWFYDLETLRFLAVNEAAVARYGYSREEFLRMTLRDIRPTEDLATLNQAVERVRSGLRVSGTYRHRKRDGTVFPVDIFAHSTTFNGRPAIFIMAFDVTERRALETRLALSDRLATMGAMAAGVAHEINNPLTYVLGNVDYVIGALRGQAPAELPGTAPIVEALEEAHRGTRRIHEIVADLQSLSRGADEPPRPVALRRAVEGALSMAAAQVRHRARVTCAWGEAPPVLASEGKLGQVFLNLLINAAQALPIGAADQHEIRLTTWAEPGVAACAVEDTGSGIAPEHLPRIFDPFFTTKAPGEGTGLGLAICQGIVTSLGGTISVESLPARGTRFVVRLPATAEAEVALPAGGTQPGQSGRRRVLVVDDEVLIGRVVKRSLESHCDTAVETSARAALDRLRSGEQFDLVLCDMMMPEMSGVDFHAAVLAAAPAVAGRIAFITGGAFTAREQAFLQRPGVIWLEKPLDFAKVAELLERSD